jgi:hypothetical protein
MNFQETFVIAQLKAELQDPRKPLNLLTRFVDDNFKDLQRSDDY